MCTGSGRTYVTYIAGRPCTSMPVGRHTFAGSGGAAGEMTSAGRGNPRSRGRPRTTSLACAAPAATVGTVGSTARCAADLGRVVQCTPIFDAVDDAAQSVSTQPIRAAARNRNRCRRGQRPGVRPGRRQKQHHDGERDFVAIGAESAERADVEAAMPYRGSLFARHRARTRARPDSM